MQIIMKNKFIFASLLSLTIAGGCIVPAPANVQQTADEIRTEALRGNSDPTGHALPLLAAWNTGKYYFTYPTYNIHGVDPAYQLSQIENGHHVFLTAEFPAINATLTKWQDYYKVSLESAAALNLPLTLLGTQWEQQLTLDDDYFDLPAEQNPNVVKPDGTVLAKLSPFGPVELWYEIGEKWASSVMMQHIQQWYPNPPLVEFLSNNESPKLTWMDAEEDARYLQLYGTGRSDEFKREVVGAGWIERYRALQDGMRDALTPAWQSKVLFAGYGAFGGSFFGRWGGWPNYSLHIPGRFAPDPLAWDGGSPSYYCASYSNITDFKVMSPQIESMNWIFMQNQALQLNPDFRFNLSIWDGHTNDPATDWRAHYESLGQQYTTARYVGYAQFGMWLLRPRVLREYRGWTENIIDMEPWFLALSNSVDNIYSNTILKSFWRTGELVPNHVHQHPYQTNIPNEYANVERWFLLDTSLDPVRPWSLNTEIPVYSLALVTGEAGSRSWLVYAHSPVQDRQNVVITIPDYGNITVDVPVTGTFYVVDENSQQVTPL